MNDRLLSRRATSGSMVIEALAGHARQQPQSIALVSGTDSLTYSELHSAVDALAEKLGTLGARTVATIADNGIAWAIADLAVLAAGLICVPLPRFFSSAQNAHALTSAGVDLLLADSCLAPSSSAEACQDSLGPDQRWLHAFRLPHPAVELPPLTRKVTFTSGTTGSPKGVCLGVEEQELVAASLLRASNADSASRHLCVLPLATLLENIGGLHAPLLVGATSIMPRLADVGLTGSSGLDVQRLLAAIREARATSLILVPQLLQAMITAIDAGAGVPDTLRFIAVGGASVWPRLLNRASELGLPLYEGYGLSECSSVVALNSPQACRRSSVGKPLPHIRVELAEDGEILVRGNAFRGYVGEPPHDDDAAIGTGDLGRFDEDGFLYVTGRKKTVFVTAYGRNVSPEWIERELCMEPVIAQAAVFGEAAPWNAAVIVPRTVDRAAIQSAIDRVNQTLPDYARVHQWISANAPFSHANDQATVNGRLRRSAIALAYGRRIRELYNEVHA